MLELDGQDHMVEMLHGLACEVKVQMLLLLYVSDCVVGGRSAGLLAQQDNAGVVELWGDGRGCGEGFSSVHVVGLKTFGCWCCWPWCELLVESEVLAVDVEWAFLCR